MKLTPELGEEIGKQLGQAIKEAIRKGLEDTDARVNSLEARLVLAESQIEAMKAQQKGKRK